VCNHFAYATRPSRPKRGHTGLLRSGGGTCEESAVRTLPAALPVTLPTTMHHRRRLRRWCDSPVADWLPGLPGNGARPSSGRQLIGIATDPCMGDGRPTPGQKRTGWTATDALSPATSDGGRSATERQIDAEAEFGLNKGVDAFPTPSLAGQASPNTSASASSGVDPATILALILTALTALVAPVWRTMAMTRSRMARYRNVCEPIMISATRPSA